MCAILCINCISNVITNEGPNRDDRSIQEKDKNGFKTKNESVKNYKRMFNE